MNCFMKLNTKWEAHIKGEPCVINLSRKNFEDQSHSDGYARKPRRLRSVNKSGGECFW
jgi:hypothetical protein